MEKIREMIKRSWEDLRVDRFYRSGSRIAGLAFGILVWVFMALPSLILNTGTVYLEIPAWRELFIGSIQTSAGVYDTVPAFYSVIGYLLILAAGVASFLFNRPRSHLFALISAILGFILVAAQPVFSGTALFDAYGVFPTYGSGWLLPLGFSLGQVIVQAILTVYKRSVSE